MYDIVIIGAGFSGAYAALELAKDGYKILVLESSDQVVGPDSTSYNQCYKLHSGVHYFGDALTARKCLLDSIICAKKWSQFLLGNDGSLPRRNRHYVMSNSLFSTDDAKNVATMLSQTYAGLVKKDPANKVFGEPDNFIKEVTPEHYDYVSKKMLFTNKGGDTENINVALALDVGEPQVDIKKIRKFLQYEITHTKNITPRFNCEVTNIQFCQNDLSYKVTALETNPRHKRKSVEFEAKGVVNCAWQNIEELNRGVGISETTTDNLLIRMKLSLLVKLPQELENMDTCIFSLGPYCSITNQYDGTAILTYEPATNIGHYFQGVRPPEEIKFIKKHRCHLAETAFGKKISREIIDGCTIYVPNIKNSQLLEIRVGYVKMHVSPHENYSIYDKDSPVHRRREDGIVTHEKNLLPCYISASGMKMTYAQSNAEKIRVIMREKMASSMPFKQAMKKYALSHEKTYKEAEQIQVLLSPPTLLRNPVTLKYFIPKYSQL